MNSSIEKVAIVSWKWIGKLWGLEPLDAGIQKRWKEKLLDRIAKIILLEKEEKKIWPETSS